MRKLHYVMDSQGNNDLNSSFIDGSPSFKFEKRIRDLLKSLGFKKVNGGVNFQIGGNQIDACGICEDKLIICECTTRRSNIKSKIAAYIGLHSSIKNGISNIPEYRDYAKKDGVIFIFASYYNFDFNSYSQLSDKTINFWNQNEIKYYEKIAKDIKNRAKYDVLADLGCEIKDKEAIKLPAFRVSYDNVDMYSFFAKPDDLIKVSYVARRESGKRNYYQRMLDPKRLIKIKDFLDRGNIFPTNIVVGIEGKPEFKKDDDEFSKKIPNWVEIGMLTLPKSYQGCWIIDGQHRLFSFELGMKQKLSVLALYNVSLNKQADYFVKINKEAKPVGSNLIWDLCGDLTPDSPDGKISNAVKILNLKSDYFKGKISIPSQGSGSIKMTTFCETLKKVCFGEKELKTGLSKKSITKNPFYSDDPKKHINNLVKQIDEYYAGIQIFISKDRDNEYLKDFLFDNGGISVFIQLYKIIICVEDKKINEDLLVKYIRPIIEFIESGGVHLIKDYRKRCASEGGKSDVLRELLDVIKDKDPRINLYLVKNTSIRDLLAEFESKMREYLIFKLKDKDFKLIRNNINRDLVNRIGQKIERLNTDYSLTKFCNELSLGDLKLFIYDSKYLWNLFFKDIFVRLDPNDAFLQDIRYPHENMFNSDFDFVITARNIIQHDKYKLTRKDETRVRDFIDTMSSIIEKDQLSKS